ncbi:hypothetical protein [Pseudanabaena sp. 'Roaring Creek']|uniref:phage tail fiber protein n=1 Tax=Pseudanabaena sp. 'Roaring Creek' TaxID=1681830 RepID=UPI0006D8062F|nr:hypothetical protein [Pseudanabaena sp. 'Roaring Creek']
MTFTSSYLQSIQLGYILGNAYPSPPTLWWGFHTSGVDVTGSNEITPTLVSGRISASSFSTPTTVGSNVQASNSLLLDWGNALIGGSVAFLGLWDSQVGGNFLMPVPLQDSTGAALPLTFNTGDPVTIAASAITLSLDIISWSVWERTNQLNWLLGTAHPDSFTNLYVGLSNSLDPTGAGTEVTSLIATTRLAISPAGWTPVTSVGSTKEISNALILPFGNSLGATPDINNVGVWTAAVGGNLIVCPLLTLPYPVNIGKKIYIPIGGLRLVAG